MRGIVGCLTLLRHYVLLLLDEGFAGILLLVLGGYLILNNIITGLREFITWEMYNAIMDVVRLVPQGVLGIAIIVVGIRLIMGKKKERDTDA